VCTLLSSWTNCTYVHTCTTALQRARKAGEFPLTDSNVTSPDWNPLIGWWSLPSDPKQRLTTRVPLLAGLCLAQPRRSVIGSVPLYPRASAPAGIT